MNNKQEKPNGYNHSDFKSRQQSKEKQSQSQLPQIKKPDPEFFSKIEKDFVKEAETVMLDLFKNSDQVVSTNQIRNILSLINNITLKINLSENKITPEIKNDIRYLIVKIYYACGKDENESKKSKPQNSKVKEFVDKSKIIDLILYIDDNVQKWTIFSKYVEALIAYHKYFGGKD